MKKLPSVILILVLFGITRSSGQQLPDTSYIPVIKERAYPNQDGTTIFIDEAHNNFHTKDGRYTAFARLLELDGYKVESNKSKFSVNSLSNQKILVLANARHETMPQPVVAPIPSAFSPNEIEAVKKWVEDGGSLFLIADHMPFAGAAAVLAKAFGFIFYDSFVMYDPRNGTIEYTTADGSLSQNIITTGRNSNEKVSHVRSFTGQGFVIPDGATSILNLDESQTVYLTDTVLVFNDKVKTFPAEGLSQGAIINVGKGKVVMWGEAAMFTSQLSARNGRKFGMSAQGAEENYQLLLNIIHWLDDKL